MRKGIDYIGTCVIFFCHDGEGRFLVGRRSDKCRDEHGKLDIGGGGMKFGQTIEENLRREILEEYCAEVLDYEFLGYRDVHRIHNGERTHWVALDFKVLLDPNMVKIGEQDKCVELKWLNVADEMPFDDMHSQFPAFFQAYQEKLTKI